MRAPPAITLALLVLVVIAPGAPPAHGELQSSDVVISQLHPGGSVDWECVAISNRGPFPVDVSRWNLSDGEGRLELPPGASVDPHATVHVAVNASRYETLWGRPPDVLALRRGAFCLADSGDDLVLFDRQGRARDQVWYGGSKGHPPAGWSGDPVPTPASMPWGRVLLRREGVDTGTAADWTRWTEPRCGWLDPRSFPGPSRGNVTTFVTPEGGWGALSSLLASAEERVTAAVYGLTSGDLVAVIAGRAREGVGVRLLVEDDVVGMSDATRSWRDGLLSALEASGAEVFTTAPMEERVRHRPYRYHHEKCCVVDGRAFLVTTENWGPSAFPPSPEGSAFSSRGWGAVVDCGPLAAGLEALIEHDIELCGQPWNASMARAAHLPSVDRVTAPAPPDLPARVGLLVGPEGWGDDLDALVGIIDDALETLDLELADLDVSWDGEPSPLVAALLDAARRGVRVRLLLDQGFQGEGALTVDELHLLAAGAGVRGLRGLLASGIPGVARVHAKGAIVDGRKALLGSLNWARSSIARNREVDVVVEGAGAIAPLREAFEADWCASISQGRRRIPEGLFELLLEDWAPPEDGSVLPPRPGSSERARGGGSDGGSDWRPLYRAALVLGGGTALWWVDRRFRVRERARSRMRRLSRRLGGGFTSRAADRAGPPAEGPEVGLGEGPPRGQTRRGRRTVRILDEGEEERGEEEGEAGS